MNMKQFGLIETKLFHFHRISKNRAQGGDGVSVLPEPPFDPSLSYILKCQHLLLFCATHVFMMYFFLIHNMSRNMGFPTMWYVQSAKAQTSLRKRAVLSELLLVA